MKTHLQSGCESCAKEKATWSKMAAFAKAEAQFEPPEHVVNMAKALVQARKPEKALRLREIAELVFDSFLTRNSPEFAPLPALVHASFCTVPEK